MPPVPLLRPTCISTSGAHLECGPRPTSDLLKERWTPLDQSSLATLTLSGVWHPWVWGFPGGASGKEHSCQCRRHRDIGLIPGWGRSPGGGHGTHSSILAWRIPWTEEPGGLQSIGSQRVRHNWNNLARTHGTHGSNLAPLFIREGNRIWNKE